MSIRRRGHGDPRGSCLETLEPVHHPSSGWRHTYDRAPARDVNRRKRWSWKDSNVAYNQTEQPTGRGREAGFVSTFVGS